MTRTTFSAYRLERLSAYVRVQPGYAFASEKFTDDPSDCPLVKGENVQQGYVDWGAAKYWPQSEIDDFAAYELRAGDVVVAMDRPWVQAGLKWAYIRQDDPRALLVQRVARLTAKDGLDQTYLRCLISSAYFAAYVQPIVTGVNVPHISGKQIGDFLIPVPELAVQRKIAAILSAYDDLITNSQRRIVLLEGMAEEIYREWFVRMRFPGWKIAKFRQGIPERWTVMPLEALFRTASGGTPSRTESQNFGGDVAWVKTGELKSMFVNSTEERISTRGLESSAAKVLPKNTVVMAMYCAMPDVAILGIEAATNQACCALLPKREALGHQWTYFFARSALGHLVNFAHGAAQQNLSQEIIRRFRILYPGDELVEQYCDRTKALFAQIQLLSDSIGGLVQARDALLPRLISGKLKVDHLDIRLPPSMRAEAEAVA